MERLACCLAEVCHCHGNRGGPLKCLGLYCRHNKSRTRSGYGWTSSEQDHCTRINLTRNVESLTKVPFVVDRQESSWNPPFVADLGLKMSVPGEFASGKEPRRTADEEVLRPDHRHTAFHTTEARRRSPGERQSCPLPYLCPRKARCGRPRPAAGASEHRQSCLRLPQRPKGLSSPGWRCAEAVAWVAPSGMPHSPTAAPRSERGGSPKRRDFERREAEGL